MSGLAFSPDGKTLYGCEGTPGRIVLWQIETGEKKVHAENVKPNDVVVAHDGWHLVATAMGVQICNQPG